MPNLLNFLLFLALPPLTMTSCKKSNTNEPPPIAPAVYVEVSPLEGRSVLTFQKGYKFKLKNLNFPTGLDAEYSYKWENGKLILTAPAYNSALPPNPVSFEFSSDGKLTTDNFRFQVFGSDAEKIVFRKQ